MSEWKLVPVEPTEEMLESGMDNFYVGQEKLMSEWVRRMYQAMLKAAPKEISDD